MSQTKNCRTCLEEKEIELFVKSPSCIDGYGSKCRVCYNKYRKELRDSNKEEFLKKRREYLQKNKDRNLQYQREYHKKNKQVLLEKRRVYQKLNRKAISGHMKKYVEKNKQECVKYQKEYVKKRMEADPEYKERYMEHHREYKKKHHLKKANDPKYALDCLVSSGIRKDLRRLGLSKSKRGWQDVVGYTVDQLKAHLESLFTPEMSWENRGTYWHIDHIRPKSWFTYTSVDDPEFRKCWGLSNLQPLKAVDNIKKCNKYEG